MRSALSGIFQAKWLVHLIGPAIWIPSLFVAGFTIPIAAWYGNQPGTITSPPGNQGRLVGVLGVSALLVALFLGWLVAEHPNAMARWTRPMSVFLIQSFVAINYGLLLIGFAHLSVVRVHGGLARDFFSVGGWLVVTWTLHVSLIRGLVRVAVSRI